MSGFQEFLLGLTSCCPSWSWSSQSAWDIGAHPVRGPEQGRERAAGARKGRFGAGDNPQCVYDNTDGRMVPHVASIVTICQASHCPLKSLVDGDFSQSPEPCILSRGAFRLGPSHNQSERVWPPSHIWAGHGWGDESVRDVHLLTVVFLLLQGSCKSCYLGTTLQSNFPNTDPVGPEALTVFALSRGV